MFFGIFDGTVGDFAAEAVHVRIAQATLGNAHFASSLAAAAGAGGSFARSAEAALHAEAAVRAGYVSTDAALLRLCAEAVPPVDYSSCTAVTALLTGDLLTVAHLGDSRVAIGSDGGPAAGGALVGRALTTDHKPDMPEERLRIERAGGSLAYLHGGKPFIRGGDFSARQARGERPMQLNYSRAFGGKDLKPYGLTAEPGLVQCRLSAADRLVILASDGLWDVASADAAVRMAADAYAAGRDPALELAQWALQQHDARQTVDNITVTAVFLSP